MFSDNGQNFVGANYKLLKEYNEFLKTAKQHVIAKYIYMVLHEHSFLPIHSTWVIYEKQPSRA